MGLGKDKGADPKTAKKKKKNEDENIEHSKPLTDEELAELENDDDDEEFEDTIEYNPAKTKPIYAEGKIKHKTLKNGYAHTFIFRGRDHRGEEAIAFFRFNKLTEEHQTLFDELIENGPKDVILNYDLVYPIKGVTNYKSGDDILSCKLKP